MRHSPTPLSAVAVVVTSGVLVFIIFAAILWNMPDSWRVHPHLVRPTLVSGPILSLWKFVKTIGEDRPSIVLIGDSAADCANWENTDTIFMPGHPENFKHLLRKIWRHAESYNGYNRAVIICASAWGSDDWGEKKMSRLERVARRRFPKAEITVITPREVHAIAEIHSPDRVHPSKVGYAILGERYNIQ
jgi:hypothetical protein